MNQARVFISYSRQELYFAESLALNLQASGIPVWMDIQQLEPGSDWAEGIRKGLEGSTAVVLIASRQALKSPYVREEWTAALNARKPVYVAFFEFVHLPAALDDNPQVSYFNFRRNFDQKVRQLSDCLKANSVHRDSVDVWRFLVLPTANYIVIASLLLPSLILLTWLVAIFRSGFNYFYVLPASSLIHDLVSAANFVVVWVYLIAAGIGFSGDFVRRRFEVFSFRLLPFMFSIYVWFAFRALDPITHGQSIFRVSPHDIPFYTDNFVFVGLGLLGLACVSFWLQSKSADILRWMPLGQAPMKMREAINARFVKSEARSWYGSDSRSAGTYRIFYDPADENVAQEVEDRLQSYCYKRVDAASPPPASIVVFMLSNYADLEKLKQAAGVLPKQTTAVVATSIKMPASREELFRFQWVDYRRRTSEQLERIDQLLRGNSISNIQSSITVDPESMGKVVVPSGIFFVANALCSLGALVLGSGLYLLALLGMGKGGSWQGVLIVALGMAMFWLAGRLTERRLRSQEFMAGYGILWLALFLLNVSGILWVWVRNYGADIYTGQPTIFGYAEQAVLLFLPPALAVYYRGLIARWLPRTVKHEAPSKSLQLRDPNINWFAYSLVVLFTTTALLASTKF